MDYFTFWQTYFPEQATLSRVQALATTGMMQRYATIEELHTYQNSVASVYGAYELAEFQLATLNKLFPHLQRVPSGGTLVSLGSGPGSYELWLLAENRIQSATLVDISEEMLKRADRIAAQLELTDRIELICSEVGSVELPDNYADVCLSINSLHWDTDWRTWIKKAIRYTKPNGLLFLSASLLFPQSDISATQFVGVAERGMTIRENGFVLPATSAGQTTRYFVTGSKSPAGERKKKK